LGAPLDFVAFHAKGAPKLVDGKVQMGIMAQFNKMGKNFEVISSFPELKGIPVIIGESDPEGCAACSQEQYPQNAYRNGTMYSSYTASSVARLYDMADFYHINLIGAVNWSFEFENQPWFYGFRDLATNGVDKPVLNVFRMLGMMSGNRVEVSGNMTYDFLAIRDSRVRGQKTDVNALAVKDKGKYCILLWNYHDDDISENGSTVELTIHHPDSRKAKLFHYRIDREHSNSYEVWKKLVLPKNQIRNRLLNSKRPDNCNSSPPLNGSKPKTRVSE
jgi:xylan 1,4-beta-xylosidase